MALFGKKAPLDEIFKKIDKLTPEEREELKNKIADLDKAEDEREIDKIEEEKAESTETATEKGDEVKEESEEIGEDVDTVEEEVKTDEVKEEKEPETEEPTETEETETEKPLDTNTDDEPVEEPTETPTDETPEIAEQHEDVDEAQSARLGAIEDRQQAIEERLNELFDMLQNGDFGVSPDVVSEDNDKAEKYHDAVMRGYAGNSAGLYK